MIKIHHKFIPVFVVLFIYIMLLIQTIFVAIELKNNMFFVLGLITPIPLIIGIIVCLIKLTKQQN